MYILRTPYPHIYYKKECFNERKLLQKQKSGRACVKLEKEEVHFTLFSQ